MEPFWPILLASVAFYERLFLLSSPAVALRSGRGSRSSTSRPSSVLASHVCSGLVRGQTSPLGRRYTSLVDRHETGTAIVPNEPCWLGRRLVVNFNL